MVGELDRASKIVGLKMNLSKTKVMFNKNLAPQQILVDNSTLEQVDEYIYLGQLISSNGKQINEIQRRMKIAWKTIG